MPIDNGQVAINLEVIRWWSHVLGILLAGYVLYRTRAPQSRWLLSTRGCAFAALVLAIAYGWTAGFGRVQAGARGVVLRFGAPTVRLLGEGLYAVVPFAESVVSVNTQTNTITFDRAQGTCNDLEPVYANLAVSFHVVPARSIDVYRQLRANYAARIVRPAVLDAWKSVVAQYATSDLIDKRDEVQKNFRAAVVARIESYGLALDSVSTTRFNFAYAYAQAAQLKVASVQRTLEAKQDLQRVRFESQQSVIRAKSEVEALKLQRHISVQQLIRMRQLDLERHAIDKWDGHLPQSTTTMPFLGGTLGQKSD